MPILLYTVPWSGDMTSGNRTWPYLAEIGDQFYIIPQTVLLKLEQKIIQEESQWVETCPFRKSLWATRTTRKQQLSLLELVCLECARRLTC